MSSFGKSLSPVVDKTMHKRSDVKRAKNSIIWCIVNLFVACVLYSEMSCGFCLSFLALGFPPTWLYYAEGILVIIFLLNAVSHLFRYFGLGLRSPPVELTNIQRKLLGVSDNEPGFRICANKEIQPQSPTLVFSPSGRSANLSMCSRASPSGLTSKTPSPYNRSTSHSPSPAAHGYSSFNSSSHSHSPSPKPTSFTANQLNYSYSPSTYAHGAFMDHSYAANSSALHTNTSSLHASFNRSLGSPLSPTGTSVLLDRMDTSGLRSRLHNVSAKSSPLRNEDCITDQKSLDQYLKEYEEKEYKTQLGSPENAPTNSSSFWNFNRTLNDYTPVLRKYKYQIACRSPQSTKSTDNDSDDPATYRGDEVWSQLGISVQEDKLDKWVENLRKWVSQTILVRLISEIKSINKELARMVSEDMQVGEVSISTLKQLAITKSQHIPTLNAVIPYLEVCANQEYLIQRIKDLGAGGCMSGFKWNGGANFKGKVWGEHLPTDSAIIMHMVCTYMDSRLPPHPKYPDGKTFTNEHFLKTPDKPDLKKGSLVIYQTKINPPHFKVIIDDDTMDLPKGRNNMFFTLLYFLYHVKIKERGMLGRVNLGLSGVNILWVVDE